MTAEEIVQDFEVSREGFQLLTYDYLGGNGSRGYGRVKVSDFDLCVVVGDVSDELIDQCIDILNR